MSDASSQQPREMTEPFPVLASFPLDAEAQKPLALMMIGAVAELRGAVEEHCRVVVWREVKDRDAFLAAEGPNVRILVTAGGVPLRPEMLDRLPGLQLIAYFGVGHDGVDVEDVRRRGVALSYAPNTNCEDVADVALGLTISAVRRLNEGEAIIRAGGWSKPLPVPMAPSLRSLRYGIAGLGAIGGAVAERLEPLGGPISWWGPRPKPDVRWPRAESLLELARGSDVLIVALKADDSTRGMIDAAVLEALGPGGYLINVSRGFVVDEEALVAALREGRLAGAGLDVFAREPTDRETWRDLPNVAMSPHIGGWARGSIRAAEALVAENIRRALADEPLATPIP